MSLFLSAGQPMRLRAETGQWLITHDPWHLHHHLQWNLHHLRDPAALSVACDVITQQGWRDLTPALVRSWSRPWRYVDDMDRHEARAIQTLWPNGSLQAVIVKQIVDPEPGPNRFVHQVAGWQLLCRLISPRRALRQVVARPAPGTDSIGNAADIATDDPPDMASRPSEGISTSDAARSSFHRSQGIDLPRWLADMHAKVRVIPATRFEVLRLLRFQSHDDGRLFAQAINRAAQLRPMQLQGLAVRHLPVLATAHAERLAMSRDQLREQIRQRLVGRSFVFKPEAVSGPGMTQRFDQSEPSLVWADLLTLHLLLDAMDDAAVRGQWIDQAQADHADTRTEHGGLLLAASRRFVAQHFIPDTQVHDLMFVPSAAMVQREPVALAPYHFHVARQPNAAFACPGEQDMVTATRLGQHSLVLTYVGSDQLNVDYYQPGRISVDLGTIGGDVGRR